MGGHKTRSPLPPSDSPSIPDQLINSPFLLLAHGDADETIPVEDAGKIAARLEPGWVDMYVYMMGGCICVYMRVWSRLNMCMCT